MGTTPQIRYNDRVEESLQEVYLMTGMYVDGDDATMTPFDGELVLSYRCVSHWLLVFGAVPFRTC
jgi:hypothetical protein